MQTWILLRGLSRERRHWGDFEERFARIVPESSVFAIDLPGNGALSALSSPTRVEDMTVFCRKDLAHRKITPPYNLFAMSLGAMVALDWAYRHPLEIARCVLINTSVRSLSPFYHRLRPQNYLPLLNLALLGGNPEDWEIKILRRTSRLRSAETDIARGWAALRRDCPPTRRNVLRQLLAAARFRARSAPPVAALLVLASRRDQLVDVRCSLALARDWDCPIRIHEGAGHDLPLDDAEWTARRVRDWIDGTG